CTFGLADRGLSWVSDDMSVSGDEVKVLAEKDGKTYENQQSHIVDKDLIRAYVRLSAEDNTTVSNNNSNIFIYAMPLISTWIQDGGL
ncbi:ABC transporter, partial [Bifidobacterium pseudocatenulatum]|nr:ABC transporter [Bifidobacterium pseudocatenulatum]